MPTGTRPGTVTHCLPAARAAGLECPAGAPLLGPPLPRGEGRPICCRSGSGVGGGLNLAHPGTLAGPAPCWALRTPAGPPCPPEPGGSTQRQRDWSLELELLPGVRLSPLPLPRSALLALGEALSGPPGTEASPPRRSSSWSSRPFSGPGRQAPPTSSLRPHRLRGWERR